MGRKSGVPGINGMLMNPRKKQKKTNHSGSTFDSFLEQEGIREEVEGVAIKRLLAWRLQQVVQQLRET